MYLYLILYDVFNQGCWYN